MCTRLLIKVSFGIKHWNFKLLIYFLGSLLQLYRHFGEEKAQHILRQLKAVYISHLHADHHLGLINIIQDRARAFAKVGSALEPLYLLAPGRIDYFLLYYHMAFEPIVQDLIRVKNEHLLLNDLPGDISTGIKTQNVYPHVLNKLLDYTGLNGIYTSRAIHCTSAYCVAFHTQEDNYKVVYTGDTRPNPALIELGKYKKSPDLLIHEATMEHKLLHDAKLKRHSTFKEAINSGQEMSAKQTLLTHFSQRYHKVPCLDEIHPHANVGIAFDNLSVSPRTFHFIPLMYPALAKIFSEEIISQQKKVNRSIDSDNILKRLNIIVDRDGPQLLPKRLKSEKKS